MSTFIGFLFIILFFVAKYSIRNYSRKQRQDYYHKYLKSDEWQRKRYLVLKRDNNRCVYCGAKATQVHHKKYAKRNIGREPLEWLVSVCDECHRKRHNRWF